MNIGIIGTGAVGSPLARNLAAAGHNVKVTNTRPFAELTEKAQSLGASPATLEDVVKDVDIVFISVPFGAIPKFPQDLFRSLPDHVIVADTGNYYPFRDEKIDALEQGQVESVWVAQQLGRPITKAFNNLLSETIAAGGKPEGTPGRIALSIAGDDERAKQVIAGLANELGFDVVDAGSLADSWRQQPGTPAYCTELTAAELTAALDGAVPGKAPQIRDEIIGELAQRTSMPTREEMVAGNRARQLGKFLR
ncbi:NADPH-dependent F420 reductase [Dyadobacter sp. MSC1_007]|jgi:predicted dinucleotide-binding enzyme|uniref:NADPH-dependent F420 reductase n=1 Tax=Dyadobacter sp. MSC1_007 TaxID=2909264 RepID=UPI00202FF3B8|nr:NAD(P)-binding domain-containing protein [Dyadobacter sp. MSC1_007]